MGEQAKSLYADAQQLLKRILDEKLLKAKAVFGLFEANTINTDDIEVTSENGKFIFRTLRQQLKNTAIRQILRWQIL